MSTDKKGTPLTQKQIYLQSDPEYEQLYKQRQQQMQQKIDKSIEKQRHILKIEQELEEKLRKKNQQILRKLNKSIEAKNQKVLKIKQKCQLRIKYQAQKVNEHKKKEKMQLHRSWRESLKLSEWIMKKNPSNRRITTKINQQRSDNEMEEKDEVYDMGSKTNKGLPNLEKVKKDGVSPMYQTNKINSLEEIPKRYSRVKSEHSRPQKQIANSINYVQKLRQKQDKEQKEQLKRINLKLQKLQEARMKKQKLQRDRQKKIHDLLNYKSQKLKQNQNHQKSKRIDAQHKRSKTIDDQDSQINNEQHLKKSNMFKRWQQNSKLRQVQLFESRLRKGQDYISYMKDKSLKNKINRSVQQNTIQRKLYMERKRMYELMSNCLKNVST